MKKVIFSLIIIIILSCTVSTNYLTIEYEDYKMAFDADNYSKSITEFYAKNHNLEELNHRQLVIKSNSFIFLEDLIDNILRIEFNKIRNEIDSSRFNKINSKLRKYYKSNNINYLTNSNLIDRTQQWFADSIVQSKYPGKIYYNKGKKTLKPVGAYKLMVLDLIDKEKIKFSEKYLEEEIKNKASNIIKESILIDTTPVDKDFFKIETW